MKLAIIIPVLNEEKSLQQVVKEVIKVKIPFDKEIIIINDNSNDKSLQIINSLIKENPETIKFVDKKKTEGKGSAIRDAMALVSGEVILIQDADQEYNVEDYKQILNFFINNEAEVVLGSRFLGKIENMKFANLIANKILTTAANLIYGIHITDEATAYKAFKTEIIKKIKIKSHGFEFCPEIMAKVAKLKCRIKEAPVSYKARTAEQGKKIKWQDGIIAFWTLIKYRFID